jgi:hypothetical protein
MEKLGGSKTTDECILKVSDDCCLSSLTIWQRNPVKKCKVHLCTGTEAVKAVRPIGGVEV